MANEEKQAAASMPDPKEEKAKTSPEKAKKVETVEHTNATKVALGLLIVLLIAMFVGFGVMVLRGVTGQAGLGRRGTFIAGREFQMQSPRGNGSMGGRMRGSLQNVTTAKVTAVNDKQFTVDVSGTSKTVQISDSTRFPLDSTTTVKVGDSVQVVGQQDSAGVIQATEIVVNPTN